jgi:hypothetical protein
MARLKGTVQVMPPLAKITTPQPPPAKEMPVAPKTVNFSDAVVEISEGRAVLISRTAPASFCRHPPRCSPSAACRGIRLYTTLSTGRLLLGYAWR